MEIDRLEYDAEVAYITATSPVPANPGNRESMTSLSEFEFTTTVTAEQNTIDESSKEADKNKQEKGTPKQEKDMTPKQLKKKSSLPKLVISPAHSPGVSDSSSLDMLTPPHYTLDTSMPTTPKSRLMRIQEAQASPPSPKLSSKFQTALDNAHYKYRTLVIYGHAGCGKTSFVEKLVGSNPAVFSKVISNTTRKKRAGEVEGIDFHYISPKEMSLGMARGDYLEYVQLQKRPKKRIQRAATSDADMMKTAIMKATEQRRPTVAELPTEIPTPIKNEQRASSKFDLLDEDSPLVNGEIIGTTKQAMAEAAQLGKPCIVLNVTVTGAQQLKRNGLKATYIFIHSGPKPPKQAGEPDLTISTDQPNEAYKQLHEYAMKLIEDLQLTQTTKYDIIKHEWDSLPTVKLETEQAGRQASVQDVTFSEVLTHFQSINFRKEKELVKEQLPKEGTFSRNKLDKKLRDERLLVLAMASCLLDKNKLHLRILQTIYMRLTGRNINCRRYGSHWKVIGFSGADPADDLDNVGVFGLVELIYLLDTNNLLAREIYRYTKQAINSAPFCILSFQITQIALSALKDGSLTKLANKREQVIIVVNEFYTAVLYHYYTMWRAHGTNLFDPNALIKSVQDYACKHVPVILKNYADYQSKKQTSRQAPPSLIETTPKPFTSLDDYSDV